MAEPRQDFVGPQAHFWRRVFESATLSQDLHLNELAQYMMGAVQLPGDMGDGVLEAGACDAPRDWATFCESLHSALDALAGLQAAFGRGHVASVLTAVMEDWDFMAGDYSDVLPSFATPQKSRCRCARRGRYAGDEEDGNA